MEVLPNATGQEKQIKGIQIGTEKNKTVFADDDCLYRKFERTNKKRKLLGLISYYSKVAGYKADM